MNKNIRARLRRVSLGLERRKTSVNFRSPVRTLPRLESRRRAKGKATQQIPEGEGGIETTMLVFEFVLRLD